MTELEYSFIRYLTAKKGVDDRALNPHVWDALAASLPDTSPENPLQILEIGAGTGTMIERMIERNLFDYAEYIGIDVQEQYINYAKHHLPIWAREQGLIFEIHKTWGRIIGNNVQIDYQLEAIDLYEFIAEYKGRRTWDLIIAHAFLDLVDVPRVLPSVLNLGAAAGLFYFSLNYDGLTVFEPAIQPDYDRQVLATYNQTMDQRLVDGKTSGDSQTGRHLFNHLAAAGAQIIAAGSSDWVVHAQPNGYPQDEAYFLHFIIHTIHDALKDNPDIDQGRFRAWIEDRHTQVDRQELAYIAHQIDFVAKNSGNR
jgi:SAM-dependent methyltransferase